MYQHRNLDPYMGLTIHYVNSDFQLKTFLIACSSIKGRHTGPLLGQHIDKLVAKVPGLKCDTQSVCVSDNASNMLNAIPKVNRNT